MNPRLRTGLFVAASAVAAVFLGSELAEGSYALPALVAVAIAGSILVRFMGISADVIFLGFVLVGYIVGNRGFAQLMPAPGIPLLPAESALLLACSWRLVMCAFERTLPFRADILNWAVLAFLAAGTARVMFDVPRYGILAVRDFAMVYYAVFFFLAQHMARDAAARRYLVGCIVTGVVVLGPMFALFQAFERFFVNYLTVRNTPLIYYKGDLVATHLTAGSILLFHWARGRQRRWAWPASIGMTMFVLAYDSRSSLLGGFFAAVLLLVGRRWRYPVIHGAMACLALSAVVLLSVVFDNTWANRKLDGLVDRATSIIDPAGTRRYESSESANKGDNNRFRYVWWKNVMQETWSTNPLFGVGMGTDLAEGFLQEYYPDGAEDFAARSPHNIFLTVFARMGLAGLAVWLVFCAAFLKKTWHSLRHEDEPLNWGLWCGGWVILVSATFGVVLEGPMGAAVFWTLLGLANPVPAPPAPALVAPAPAGTETRPAVAVEA